jgi:phosphoglycerate dehydrogenase-like enzyme
MAPSLSEPQETVNTKPTVYLLDNFHPQVEQFCRQNFNAIFLSDPGHENWRQKAQYLLVRSSYVTAEDIAASPRLLAIGKQGVGIDKIDQASCEKRGIKILNTPGANARAVAEMVLSLTMTVARGTGSIIGKQAHGITVPKETCSGVMLHKKTIGIVGMGNIGKEVAKIFRGAFEADVIAYDPFLPADAWADIPHTRVDTVEAVVKDSDVVTLHVPLTSQTKDMIDLTMMKQMKKNAILINAARGGIVNEADLETALREKLIWGAGLDCHEQEPPTKERYGGLWELGVVSTPHIGATTGETQIITGTVAAQRILDFATSRLAI